ncbi:chemotaxis response regulator protein-glutamate methylesterase [Veronia nyctiphanis]|uniref:Protein-glutamate methylesterase/protein-glutamine glutaminase n=1 Tax=Veronia nyctiphanis TaxID=1278244 RepID=A0A4Q0YQU3_9GAMM|nr:chemotaxis response regulator protein-glutamate methylesterase [Veronia nyctiphanis]RXJ72933.1 chemotaxis response regulator protein-glutamate methylesterase [Veronia nyctiphanis]
MTLKVLVVDDSSFFRRRVSEIINGDPRLEVIDCAVNGREAIDKTVQLKPDVITMDIEMPVMDGITSVREIMRQQPTPILMFSSLTHEGAKATLDALDAGALDFLPKKFEDIACNRDEAVSLLQNRVREIARKGIFMRRASPASSTLASSPALDARKEPTLPKRPLTDKLNSAKPTPKRVAGSFQASGKRYQLLAIGTSTGGPVALQKVLSALPANFPIPIVLVQHMPATFTAAFATRLNGLCKITVKEAEDGESIRPGCAYLAPGGLQMMVDGRPGSSRIKLVDGGDRMNYKPCVDVTFGSAAKIYGNSVLSIIMTGMGADGREGSRMLKSAGSTIWAQDADSCVVYGMPQAVAKEGISSEDLPLDRIAERIKIELNLV